MKKITLLALGCAMLFGFSANAQEITYVEDPAQGYTFNKFSDNWFIQLEGGAGMLFSPADNAKVRDERVLKFKNRIGWKGDLAIGKWFSPIIGIRFGGEFAQHRGLAELRTDGKRNAPLGIYYDRVLPYEGTEYEHNLVKQNFNNIGAFVDVMINLTNWWCGYRPGRVYNAILYGGASINWMFSHEHGEGDYKYGGGKYTVRNTEGVIERDVTPDSHMLDVRLGLLNKFALSKKFDILLDLRADMLNKYIDGYGKRSYNWSPSVLLGFAYNFGKSEWTAPIVPVCPTWKYTDAEGDALVARLAAADAKIASLEKQLYDCLHRVTPTPDPKPTPVVSGDAPLATIYYPIGKSAITDSQKKVVEAVANVMKDNDKNYVLTGWADNYTGTDKINAKLRKDRVNGVKNALTKLGVGADRLDAQINDGNLTSFGPKCAALDRAVTVNEAK